MRTSGTPLLGLPSPVSRCAPLLTSLMRRTVAVASTSGREVAPVGLHWLSQDELDESDGQMMRAASYLRAHSFGVYPADRSEYAKRAHLLISANDALEQMQGGLGLSEESSAGVSDPSGVMRFFPVMVTLRRRDIMSGADGEEALAAVDSLIANGVHVHIPNGLPEETAYVCGTLDLTVGTRLPSEELIGRHGENGKRAYLSNVCVLVSLRKRGVAGIMIDSACAKARGLGVDHLYVHVVEDNLMARGLYEKCGFSVEQKEQANVARGLNRPPRLLLHRLL